MVYARQLPNSRGINSYPMSWFQTQICDQRPWHARKLARGPIVVTAEAQSTLLMLRRLDGWTDLRS
jgi:hypothetical protein